MARSGWRFETAGSLSAPLVADGLVHVACDDGHTHAIDAGSGRLRWSAQRGNPKPNPFFPPLAPALAGDTLAVTACLGRSGWPDTVLGLAAADGAQRWTYPLLGTNVTGLTADETAVVVAGRDSLTCLDPADGQPRWTVPPPQTAAPWEAIFDQTAVGDQPAVGGDSDHVYAIVRIRVPNSPTDGGYLVMAYDRPTGAEVWGVQIESVGGASLTVDGDLVCVGDAQGLFTVLRCDTGETAWSARAGRKLGLSIRSGLLPFTSPGRAVAFAGQQVDRPVITEQQIYLPSRNGDVHLLDRDTGEVQRVWRVGVPALSIAVSDELLHVGGIHGLLVALHRDRREVCWWRRLPIGRIDALAVIDDLLYVDGERHLAALDPTTGAGAWSRLRAPVRRSSYPPGSADRELTNADLPWA